MKNEAKILVSQGVRKIGNELFGKTEGLLYSYFKKKQRLQLLLARLDKIDKQMIDIRNILMDKDELVPSLGMVGNYMVLVAASGGDDGSKVEKTLSQYEKTLDNLRDDLIKLAQDKIKVKMKIMQLESETDGIEFALSTLTDMEKKIVEQKYLYQRSNVQIGIALGFEEGTIRYKRRSIVERMARILGLK